jgi:hypothetical protein
MISLTQYDPAKSMHAVRVAAHSGHFFIHSWRASYI